jgi:hypothetical protein
MLNYLKKLFSSQPEVQPTVEPQPEPKPKKPRAPRKPKAAPVEPVLSAKDLATRQGEPYIAVTQVEIDPTNINAGGFELDWNDKFVSNLIRAGYKQRDDDTDAIIVDRWFSTICRNVALELYEQRMADPDKRDSDDLRKIEKRDLGNGRSEIS